MDAIKLEYSLSGNELDRRWRDVIQLFRDYATDKDWFWEQLYEENQYLYYQNIDLLLSETYPTISHLLFHRIWVIESKYTEASYDCRIYDPISRIEMIESYIASQEDDPYWSLLNEDDIYRVKEELKNLRNKIKDCSTDV